MPSPQSEEFTLSDKQRYARIVLVLAVLVLIIGSWLLWTKVYESPANVFWGMIDNNLSTTSVVKTSSQFQSGETLLQELQLKLGSNNSLDAFSTLQASGSTVKTEEINTPSTDYVRYLSIETPQKSASGRPLNFQSLLGLWGKDTNKNSSTFSQLFPNTILGIMPIADLSPQQASQAVSVARSKSAYTVQLASVHRQIVGGRLQYKYQVKVQAVGYLEFAQTVAKDNGLTTLQDINPASYKSQPAINITVTVDVGSRDLVSVVYSGDSREESYSGYDLVSSTSLPTNTIPLSLLQSRLQSIK